jgi:hypothetical protein
VFLGGWVDGWVGGWVGGCKSRFKDCLQQSKMLVPLRGTKQNKKFHMLNPNFKVLTQKQKQN